jgi:hypothetical protein
MKLEGGCLCGAVRFSGEAEPVLQVKCHCTDCRRTAGSGHAAMIGVPEGSISFSGRITNFRSRADSGRQITRGFCSTCGSGICAQPEAAAGLVFVRASALDDPDQFTPQMAVWTASATSWDAMTAGIPSFPKSPVLPQEGRA